MGYFGPMAPPRLQPSGRAPVWFFSLSGEVAPHLMSTLNQPARPSGDCRWPLLILVITTVVPSIVQAQEVMPLDRVQQLHDQNQMGQAIEAVLQIDSSQTLLQPPSANRHLSLLARLGRQSQRSGDTESASRLYDRAAQLAERIRLQGNMDSDEISSKQAMLDLARLSLAIQMEDEERAIDSLLGLEKRKGHLQTAQAAYAAKVAIQLGGGKLSAGDWQTAASAYEIAETLGDDAQLATATLGSAWSLVVSGDQPSQAAKKLSEFLDRHRDHPDASQAMRVYARCLTEIGQEDQARQKLRELISRWPESPSALHVVESHYKMPAMQLPDEIRDWLHRFAQSSARETWSPALTALALETVHDTSSVEVQEALVKQLMETDKTGTHTTRLLDRISHLDAQRIATQFLSPPKNSSIAAPVREAACRWAGRHQHWSLIAEAADRESPATITPGRSSTIERLFAESLMQLGRTHEALPWWNHVVDQRGATDFSTLLRCAEAETAVGENIPHAEERLSTARETAVSPFAITLVDLLEAELAIRQSDFDSARSLLENVVRGSEIDENLRGRAQWLIGETHFLQQQFPDAIDAYRQVEGIDPKGDWVAPALVQAGKAFEQLGRTREASVCYGNLIQRFADSPHADVARLQIATLRPPSTEHSTGSIRR